jgi:hypothetical protein
MRRRREEGGEAKREEEGSWRPFLSTSETMR